MGCGQSKIHLYPRKSKSKVNGKKGGHADSDAETDEEEGNIEDAEKSQSREREKNDENEEQNNKEAQDGEEDISVSLLRAKNLSLLQSQEISTSQQNFFRMLDKKIEEGPDYDSSSETEIALEEARLNALVQHWESASLTASICSSASRSLQTTPIRQTPSTKQIGAPRGSMLQPTTAVAVPMPMAMPMSIAMPMQMQMPLQQQVIPTDYLSLGTSTAAAAGAGQLSMTAMTAGGALKHQGSASQLVISHMNSKMLHQLTVVPQMAMPMSIAAETSTTTATHTSNALALMQMPSTNQGGHQMSTPYAQHMLTANASANNSSPQSLGNTMQTNISPKRLMDARMLINSSPIAQQMHAVPTQPPLSNSYANPAAGGQSAVGGALIGGGGDNSTYANGGTTNSACLPRTQMQMQMAYYGHPSTAQQVPQQQYQHQQQQQYQQQQQQQHQSTSAAMVMATMTMTAAQNDQKTPQGQIQMHTIQPPTEYKFPPAISVQRLAPQVQRQLRETQELIKDSCPQLYTAGYGGSPGPPPIRNQAKNQPNRRPTLETQFSQDNSS